MGAFIEIKTKDNYNGRKTIHYATTARATLADLTGMAHAIAERAGCPVAEISFRPAGRGHLIMAEDMGRKKAQDPKGANR